MKIKLGKKKEVNEIVGLAMATVALFSVLVVALGVFYAMMKGDLKKGDENLKKGDEKAKEGAEKIPDEEAKKEFLEKYNEAKKALNDEAIRLKDAAGNQAKAAALGGRPSTLIAAKIGEVVKIIREAKAKYPDIKDFEEADAMFLQVYNDVSNLDFVLLMSVKGKDSLYEKVLKSDEKLSAKMGDPKTLYEFGKILSTAVDRKNSQLPPWKAEEVKATEKPSEETPAAAEENPEA